MRLHPPSADAKGGTVQGIRTPIMLDRAPPGAEAGRAHGGDFAGDRGRLRERGRRVKCQLASGAKPASFQAERFSAAAMNVTKAAAAPGAALSALTAAP